MSFSRKPPKVIELSSGQIRVLGFNKYLRPFSNKTALLCYLPGTITSELNGITTNKFSNEGIGRSWAEVLNKLGYKLDIVGWNDTDFRPTSNYDLVVFHGGYNFDNIYPALNTSTITIHFLTGPYWKFNNSQEVGRIKDFQKRHKVKLPHDRYIVKSEDKVNKLADGIIVVGNKFTSSTYKKYPVVIPINNANYPDNHFGKTTKDYATSKNNWLFFAGGGNIHKGLDLAIDAFKDLPQELYIITPLEKAFIKAYKNGAGMKNIHFVGELPMRTDKFYEVVDKCAFQIFPSCSEGQPGSVTEAMNQGIIPVVSKESGLDAERYGLVLKENTIDCIKKSVRQMSELDPRLVEKMAKNVRKVALKEHNPEKFIKDLRHAVQKIVDNT